jgi:putative hydrolase of the HAD superfamily
MIKAYLFDLFGTLGHYTGGKETRDFITEEEHKHLLITKLKDSILSEERKKKFLEILKGQDVVIYDDSEEVLKKLRKKYKTALISNAYEFNAKQLRSGFKDFLKNFDVVAISSELGIMKPNPEIFNYVLDGLGIKVGEAIMIGDRLELDIIPARDLGMYSILINRNFQTLKDIFY